MCSRLSFILKYKNDPFREENITDAEKTSNLRKNGLEWKRRSILSVEGSSLHRRRGNSFNVTEAKTEWGIQGGKFVGACEGSFLLSLFP